MQAAPSCKWAGTAQISRVGGGGRYGTGALDTRVDVLADGTRAGPAAGVLIAIGAGAGEVQGRSVDIGAGGVGGGVLHTTGTT